MSVNYLKGAALGMSTLTSYTPKAPAISKYDEITFFGGTSGVALDKVYGVNGDITYADLVESANDLFQPKWTPDTYLMAEFNDSLAGGNVPGVNSEILKWLVYRLDVNSGQLKPVSEVDVSQNMWIDYTAPKDGTYQYWIFGVTKTEMSAPIKSNIEDHTYYGWFLIDVEHQTAYAFNLNQTGGGVQQGENYVEHNTNSRFHIFSRGRTNFLEGTVTAIVADDCSADTQSIELVESIREFIMSDREKIIKDNKGRVFKAFVSGYSDTDVATYSDGEFKYIDFAFKQSGVV